MIPACVAKAQRECKPRMDSHQDDHVVEGWRLAGDCIESRRIELQLLKLSNLQAVAAMLHIQEVTGHRQQDPALSPDRHKPCLYLGVAYMLLGTSALGYGA